MIQLSDNDDTSQYFSRTELKKRGWKKRLILERLGDPDAYSILPARTNYRYLYLRERVRVIEQEWARTNRYWRAILAEEQETGPTPQQLAFDEFYRQTGLTS